MKDFSLNILVLNSGSSSIKFSVYQIPEDRAVLKGTVENIQEPSSSFTATYQNDTVAHQAEIKDHEEGLRLVAEYLKQTARVAIDAVGHRVVHGAEFFSEPTLVDNEVIERIEQLKRLAPLHNPPNVMGIRVARRIFPHAAQVAVFDTAYHQSLPDYAYRYPLPNSLYERYQIRVYGMHGTSHRYVAEQAAHYLDQPIDQTNLVTIHLGNGCSMAAIREGKSIDTSMGFSPLPGLMMGTRSGDIDPSVVYYLSTVAKMSAQEIDEMLNHESGLKGITGENDVRKILLEKERGNPNAELALNMYTYRIKKYIGAYLAVLGRVDGLVFTAGVGENSSYVRAKSLSGLEDLGIVLENARNQELENDITEIQSAESKVKILVVPTNEELSIARQTYALLKKND